MLTPGSAPAAPHLIDRLLPFTSDPPAPRTCPLREAPERSERQLPSWRMEQPEPEPQREPEPEPEPEPEREPEHGHGLQLHEHRALRSWLHSAAAARRDLVLEDDVRAPALFA